MQLMRRQQTWDPFRELEDLSNRFSRLLGMPRWRMGEREREALAMAEWMPSCDISETDSEYRIMAELPNVKKDDVHVTLDEGVLTIQGERRMEREEEGVRFHRRELQYGNFMRRFTMPDDADEANVDARFEDGILRVTVAKTKKKAAKAKEIAIH